MRRPQHGQWLALDPYGSDDGTLGATIATASAGPLRTSFGAPRDLVLGLEFVTGAGAIVRGGGRVVKNVAGFDLTRLLTGSWGTLGVITEVTVRLHARPEADESIAVVIDANDAACRACGELLRRLPFVPYACEVVNARARARSIGVGGATALFRLGGNSRVGRARSATALAALGDATEVDGERVAAARAARAATHAMVFRLSRAAGRLVEHVWAPAMRRRGDCPGTLITPQPARGDRSLHRSAGPAASIDALATAFVGVESTSRASASALPRRVVDGRVARRRRPTALSAGIKRTFDPQRVLNPGILGEHCMSAATSSFRPSARCPAARSPASGRASTRASIADSVSRRVRPISRSRTRTTVRAAESC